MSKETFSRKIYDVMYGKIKSVETTNYNHFIAKDEYYELALCLSYMTLSKEKIIKKDMKNTDRMARLSKSVDQTEIDKVFAPGFASRMPVITKAKENNNLWILDNIRDSIMHGVFDIDDENRCFVINNTQYDRDLEAVIPYEWIIAYAKNDILTKRKMDRYTIKGFYYNKFKPKRKNLTTEKEIKNNILYNITIYGNGTQFNVKEVEDRIRELFKEYSNLDITNEEMILYSNRMYKQRSRFNDYYLASFLRAKDKVTETISQEYPDLKLRIYIDNRKHQLLQKAKKSMPQYFTNYDMMFNLFNKTVSPKSISLLEYLSNIISELDKEHNEALSPEEEINAFNKLLNGINLQNNNELRQAYKDNIKILRSLCINVLGLSTLVINHENLYNPLFENQAPSTYDMKGAMKSKTLDYYKEVKKIYSKKFDAEIKLFEKEPQLAQCPEHKKPKIQADVDALKELIEQCDEELKELNITLKYEPVDDVSTDKEKRKHLEQEMWFAKWMETNINNFYHAKTKKGKTKVKKLICKKIEQQGVIESEYKYGLCNDMKDILVIIRNSFSHIGRISVGKDRGVDTILALNDYDNNNKRSGVVFTSYLKLINLLSEPYKQLEEEQQVKKLTP